MGTQLNKDRHANQAPIWRPTNNQAEERITPLPSLGAKAVENRAGHFDEFLTALSFDVSVVHEICDDQKSKPFSFSQIPNAPKWGRLVWDLIVKFAYQSEPRTQVLEEAIEGELRTLVGGIANNDARQALEWFADRKPFKSYPSAIKVARRNVERWQQQEENIFEFSTDADLDELLGNIEWLWEKRIPRGFVTALVAEQDEGKSTIAQDLCRTLLIGGRWPDGTQCDIKADKLLWIDTDGNLAIFHQRLRDWKMPRGRFIFPPDSLQELSIDNAANWKWIEQAIEKFQFPLIVIDALSGSHSGKENDTDSMKAIMKRLHALAQKYKIAILVIHHLNKAPLGVPAYPITIARLRGSSSISQLCRSILALTTPDPTQPTARRLDVIKLNIAKKPGPVGYVLTDNGPAWGAAPEPPKEHRASDDAITFLLTALADGPRRDKDISKEAKANGISDYAIKQARKQLHIKSAKDNTPNGAWWLSLPKQEADND